MTSFVGRTQELDALRRELDRKRPSLITVIGRRRVGKSTLLLEAVRRRRAVYYQATKVAASLNLALFKAQLAKVTGGGALLESLTDWTGVFTYISERLAEEFAGVTIILDEFPYLCESETALPSIVQKAWDEVRRRNTAINLVLCGSKISFMDQLLAEKNPLHGRQTLALDLGPLPYRDAARFLPGWEPIDRLYAYGVFGGVPYYLALADSDVALADNIMDLVLAKGAPLADEPSTLLQAELRDVARYATILGAVAAGATDTGTIIGRVREIKDASTLAPYVHKLAELRLIRIVRSLDRPDRERDRRYVVDDPFMAFWYRFYLPNASALAAGHARDVYRYAIAPMLDDYMGVPFERVCREYVRLYGQELLAAPAREVGQIWGSDYDLDVAGTLLDGTVVYGECKWWKRLVGVNVLEHLQARASHVGYGKGARSRRYLMFSRSGFTDALLARSAVESRLHLLTPAELLAE